MSVTVYQSTWRHILECWYLQTTKNKQDRQYTYRRNIEMPSRSHCCRWKAVSITYCESVSVALFIQNEKRMRGTVCHQWPVWPYNTFLHLINGTISETKKLLNIKRVLIFSTHSVWKIYHSQKNSARYYHRYPQVFMQSTYYSCQILTKLEISRQIFGKYWNIKFHVKPSSWSRVIPCWWTKDRQTWRRQ